jgi:hypothetical protein
MKPKMLFVDDRTKRLGYALTELAKEYDVTIAVCVPEALRLLSREEWDYVSLDHDLNGHDFQDPCDPTCGMEIVRYMEKCKGWHGVHKKPQFMVHSSNLFAVHLIVKTLQDMGFEAWHSPITYKEKP